MITAHIGPRVADEASWAHITTYFGGTATSCALVAEAAPLRKGPKAGGGLRGHITRFTPASRRRMFRFVGKINRLAMTRLPSLVTVTYPGVYLHKPPEIRANLRSLLKRLRRRFGLSPVLWRLEYQSRGAPHYHLLVFDPPDLEELREFVALAWFEIVGTENGKHLEHGAHVKPGTSWRGVLAYLAKYLAKRDDEEGEGVHHGGRLWGCEGRKQLPTSPISFSLSVREGLQARRWLLRAAGRRSKARGPIQATRTLCSFDAVFRMVLYLRPDALSWEGVQIRAPGEVSRRAGGPGCCTDSIC